MARLSIPIEDDLLEKLNKILPHGTKSEVFRVISFMLVDAVEKHGTGLIGMLLNKDFNLITKEVKRNAD